MPGTHLTKNYKRTRIQDPKKFDKRSMRTVDVGRPEHHKIIIGCPRRKYNSKTKRCKVGTQVQAIIEKRR